MKNQYLNILKKGITAAVICCSLTISGCKNDNDTNINTEDGTSGVIDNSGEMKVTDQYIVTFRSDQSGTVGKAVTGSGGSPMQQEANNILKAKGVQELTAAPLASFSGMINGFVAKLTPAQIDALKNNPNVLTVEQDKGFVIGRQTKGQKAPGGKKSTTTTTTTTTSPTTTTTTTSPTTSSTTTSTAGHPAQEIPWGVTAVGGHASGVGKTAWVFDTGIDYDHPELTVDQARSRSFLYSYQAANNYQSPRDEMGHGTWVSGIIAAKDNTIGLVGVAAGATLVSVRVMDRNGSGYVSSVVNGINYVAANAKPGDVANFSISFGASATMDEAIRTLASKGVYVVIGSGNAATDCSTCSPARVDAPNVYTISGMDYDQVFVSNANYGKPVDFCAPGKLIYTTDKGGGYKVVTGTSFAAPFASGVLLVTGGRPRNFSYVKCDPDPYTDPIIHRHPKP